MNDGLDAVIVKVLDGEPGADEALIAAGPTGAKRVFDLYYGTARANLVTKSTGRELGDSWSAALHIAASVAPEEFLAQLPNRVGTTDIVILGDINDPRATHILCEQARHKDFLHRVNAVRALAKHTGPASREAVEQALADENLVVRSAAIRCVADTDPSRGTTLYEAFLAEPRLTPLLRQEARWSLSYLREGSPIPLHPW
ncbi:HEAT repeat domain-containing protein [Micromonospora sp. DT46]|uniref:HEAT repeat domain-containing protein n=1 Tax=unclassified Micromonospora TaxID=2617518 RepID=UPI00124BA925|nr:MULTISPECIES: HEAT repeat domain-containing protein [unclassified Micromonospora]KAB1162386.1 HEAT repeat domain-containing protein [Micromonospora sp. AMSO12t]WSG01455.1 HEAT repeat domain-containing protein [Micromonospora sp. NBC_01740]